MLLCIRWPVTRAMATPSPAYIMSLELEKLSLPAGTRDLQELWGNMESLSFANWPEEAPVVRIKPVRPNVSCDTLTLANVSVSEP